MAEKIENKTASTKLNNFLEKNRKAVVTIFIIILVALIGFIVYEIVDSEMSKKNLAAVETIAYELTNESSDLSEADLNTRKTEAMDKLASYTKKHGIAGVRANMLAAEISFQSGKYEDALGYWKAVQAKNKKAYTAPLALYNMGVCYEEMNEINSALESYKAASETKDFSLVPHAKFSYARILETQSNFDEAKTVYESLISEFSDDAFANAAQSRLIKMRADGKIQ